MNLQSIIRKSVLACAVILMCAAPSWAVPVNIEIYSGNPNFSSTFIDTNPNPGGTKKYKNIYGTLWGDLDKEYYNNGNLKKITLSGIWGTLYSDQGDIKITGGNIMDNGTPGYAQGYLNYTLFGSYKYGVSGTFVLADQKSKLSMTELQVWAGDQYNWLSTDMSGNITPKNPVPEPSTMILLGSGLVGLVGWRYRKAQA